MRLLIVNADDLGLSPGVNSGIIGAHRLGIVTSASLMANLPEAVGAAALALENPSLGIGLHLNLTAGHPLTSCPALTWADGSFLPLPRIILRVVISPRARRQAQAEMDAQAEEALRLGIALDHLDSHHHIHLFGPLRRHAVSLATRLHVPMRLPDERMPAGVWLRYREAALASLLARRARRRHNMPRCADHTIGLALHQAGFSGHDLQSALTAIPDGVTEMICHPGRVDAELRSITHYTEGREAELEALTHPGLKAALDQAGIRLVTWRGPD